MVVSLSVVRCIFVGAVLVVKCILLRKSVCTSGSQSENDLKLATPRPEKVADMSKAAITRQTSMECTPVRRRSGTSPEGEDGSPLEGNVKREVEN